MKIAIAGTGYVGLANALLLAQKEQVKAYDIISEKVEMLRKNLSPIEDKKIHEFLDRKDLYIEFTQNFREIVSYGDYLVIATPTDYDEKKNFFNTSTVEDVIEKALAIRPDATFIIKSTVPVGYTEELKEKYAAPIRYSLKTRVKRKIKATIRKILRVIGGQKVSNGDYGLLFVFNSEEI